MAHPINRLFSKLGYRIEKYPNRDLVRRISLLKTFKIDLIFDIGANTGKYVQILRNLKYNGEVVSFEPLIRYYKILENNSKNDTNWITCNFALGNTDSKKVINVAGNEGQSSSFLLMNNVHLSNRSVSKYIGTETVQIRQVDSIINDYYNPGKNLFVKIDTQGFEKQILEGMKNSFGKITGFQIELSTVNLYEESSLYSEIMQILSSKGFELFSLEPGFTDNKTGRLLQFDGLFFKEHK